MAQARLDMRKTREILRLHLVGGVASRRQVARAMGCSKTAVSDCLRRAAAAGLSAWEAIEALDGALAIDPGYPAALLNRAVAYYRSGQGERSVADLTATLAIVGDDPDVLLNRGLAHLSAGQPGLARADFDRALLLPGADVTELRAQIEAAEREAGRAEAKPGLRAAGVR